VLSRSSNSATDLWPRVRGPVLVTVLVLTASLLLHLRDPHRSGSWGLCPWLLLTGTYCPGCGGLRAVNDLTRGDLAAAASSNLLLVAALPLFVAGWVRSTALAWRGAVRPVDSRRAVASAMLFGVLAVAFGVLRNTGAGAWLAP
jgi:Protein of unknown function (DUF2752)